MKLTIESTTKIVELESHGPMPARIWEGQLDDGTPVHLFVTRVAVHKGAPKEVHDRFEKELQECADPSPTVPVYDFRFFVD